MTCTAYSRHYVSFFFFVLLFMKSDQYMQHRLPLYQYINGLVSLAGEIQATLPDVHLFLVL